MGALFQERLADWTVDRNITLTLTWVPRVEAGSNTSTVALLVVGKGKGKVVPVLN
jgi:hypothetical protein